MAIPVYKKDPSTKLDYTIDWEDWLSSDTIATSTWTTPTGITQVSESETATTTTVWLSGGTLGSRYLCTNHITTAAGREEDQSILIVVEGK